MSTGVGTRAGSVRYGDAVIEYDLDYAARKTLAIAVEPDLRVTVSAPEDADPDAVAAIVRKRAPWILRQRRELERYLPATPERLYVGGETHRYLGRQYRLKIVEGPVEGVALSRGYLHVQARDRGDTARVAQLVDGWYRARAHRVFRERLDAMLPRFRHLGIGRPTLVVKPLRARWGSCDGGGTIILNLRLVQAPKAHIDYVVVHELCHLVEHNHGRRYYLLLDRVMPDWRERRRQLNELQLG